MDNGRVERGLTALPPLLNQEYGFAGFPQSSLRRGVPVTDRLLLANRGG